MEENKRSAEVSVAATSLRMDGRHLEVDEARSKPSIIANGLKVKLEHQTTPWSYSYALFPGTKPPLLKGWWYLVTENEETENIRLYQLVEGQDLSSLFDGFKYAKAVVLVNTEDHYELSRCFVSSVQEVSFPLLVVKKTDGEEILKHFEFLAGQGIHASVNQASDAEAQLQQDAVFSHEDEAGRIGEGGNGVAMVPSIGDGVAKEEDEVTKGKELPEVANTPPRGVCKAKEHLQGDGVAKKPPEGDCAAKVPMEVAKVLPEGSESVKVRGGIDKIAKGPNEGGVKAKRYSDRNKSDGIGEVFQESDGIVKVPAEEGGGAKVLTEGGRLADVSQEDSGFEMNGKGPSEAYEVIKMPEADELKRVSSSEDRRYQTLSAGEPSDSNEVLSQHHKEDEIHSQWTDVDESDVDACPKKTDVITPPQVTSKVLTSIKMTTHLQPTRKRWLKLPRLSKQHVEPGFENREELVAAIKEHMFFQDGIPKYMTNRDVFRHMICIWDMISYFPAKNNNEILKKLTLHMAQTYKSDFLFYILLLDLLRKKYTCDEEVKKILKKFFDDFESTLLHENVASAVLGFIQEGDFQVLVDRAPQSAFHLLQDACIELSKISHEIRMSACPNPVYSQFLYFRMLWLSIGMKFCEVYEESKPTIATKQWNEQIIKYFSCIEFTEAVISDLENGLKLGLNLKLATDYAFNFDFVCRVLANDLYASWVDSLLDNIYRDCLLMIKNYVTSTNDLMALMIQVRYCYNTFLETPNETKLKHVSKDGNMSGCLEEGIKFVDTLYLNISPNFDEALRLAEIQKWLELLVKIVDVTEQNSNVYFKRFIERKEGVVEIFKDDIKNFIRQAIMRQFSSLRLRQFLKLFESLDFWTTEDIHEFLLKYRPPQKIKFCYPIWRDFITAVVSRFKYASKHKCLVDFLLDTGNKFEDQEDKVNFIFDLFRLGVDNLLSMQSAEDRQIGKAFSNHLSKYIKDNVLQTSIIAKMRTDFLGSISGKSGIQVLLLDILRANVVPKIGLDATMLKESIQLISNSFPSKSSAKEFFCFSILSACCSSIPISKENFQWAQYYTDLQLGRVFATYCKRKQLSDEECVMAAKLSKEVQAYSSEDILKYFEWMAKLQRALQHWKEKFNFNINYPEVLLYESTLPTLKEKVYPASLLVSCEDVEKTKNIFLREFEVLNGLLLCGIPGESDAQWCSLPALLGKYRVYLPQEAQDVISRNVVFPGQEGQDPEEKLFIPPSVAKRFLPDEISLKFHKRMTLSELKNLVEKVNDFKHKLSGVDMLVFFKLNKSNLFENYLECCIEKLTKCQQDSAPFSIMQPLTMAQDVAHDSHFHNLLSALKNAGEFIDKIKSGTATYSDIIAEDKLVLQQLDIEREFGILSKYLQRTSPCDCSEALKGVRSMLELFQYAKFIETIHAVCKQYSLEKCTNDPLLQELVSTHASFANRSDLTPKEAAEKMDRVKEILLLGENRSPKYLGIFAAVSDSAAFYQFVNEKQFDGPQGQANFLQQYQLITAQLQHEEYDEQVLNHLRAAFKVISPFMNVNINFSELIKEVVSLDTVNGLRNLETVNSNITLIRLWFSRAEGDTLENVENELDCIIGTGKYTFHLGGEESGSGQGRMFLDYDFHDTSHSPAEAEFRTDPGKVRREMSDEQIRDFVRKLGFLDKDKDEDVAKKIKHFLYLSQTISKLLELYLKLCELGHPDYLTDGRVHPIPCSKCKKDLESMVQEAQNLVAKWNHEVSELQARFHWLLYLSVPKILQLNQLINNNSSDEGEWKVDRIIHEVSFLMSNQPIEKEKLRKGVLEALLEAVHQESFPSVSSPMLIVGQFLSIFLSNHSLPRKDAVNISSDFAEPLYSCPVHHSPLDFLTLILGIFCGIPEAYQVFRCKTYTTEYELARFLKRVKNCCNHYLMLDVNRLPFKLQEVLVQSRFGMQRVRGESECQDGPSIVHFVETAPSILREMPWISTKNSEDYNVSINEAQELCREVYLGFSCIEVVYGEAGNGKSHYIKEKLAGCSYQLMIAINEAFSPLGAITMLRSLPLYNKSIGLFFNFTILPPENLMAGNEMYCRIMEVVGWFFFDLLLLGYVEDPNTGLSFRLPKGYEWSIYVEVPCHNRKSADECLWLLLNDVPTLRLLGSLHFIDSDIPYDVDSDVQLVCKYLQAYKQQEIDRLYVEGAKKVKFSEHPNLCQEDCHRLLKEYMPKHAATSKITQKLFIRYMKRRCDFLDCLPAFNYNQGSGEYITKSIKTNTKKLGSTLMQTMLSEVSDFCDPSLKENWSIKPHQQLVYDFKDGGASFGLISLYPDKLSEVEKRRFVDIGVDIPSMDELYTRGFLDGCLSRALNVKLDNDRLAVVDKFAYVLTLDYTIKMLDIHERFKCGIPVIIEGETGVGKTALVEMLSRIWNHLLLLKWDDEQARLLDFIRKRLNVTSNLDAYQEYFEIVSAMSNGDVSYDSVLLICNHSDAAGKFYFQLNKHVLPMRNNPVVPLLALKTATPTKPMDTLFEEAEQEDTPEATAHLVFAILHAQVKPTFHKINVHAAMTPADVKCQFEPVLSQARALREACKQAQRFNDEISSSYFVTVFLDELNTSSCLGLFKEIIVDRTCAGTCIPDNVFIVAACNPHRGNSMASHDTWISGSYYVHSLHPTLKLLMWDYGSLNEHQERNYINAKMIILNRDLTNAENISLADLIVESQKKMRSFASRQLEMELKTCTDTDQAKRTAFISARSCVSQRDIQRVFTFYQWFTEMFKKCKRYNEETYHLRAVLLTLGLVYYMRLNADHRKEYAKYLDSISKKISPSEYIAFTTALNDELDYYISEIELPKGIARTLALKENLFATIVCTATHTPLIIVGAPGSSKTLSFNQAISNLRGQESKKDLFRDTEMFHSLDPHYYQCSRRTTSREIETVFSRAINRQRSHTRFKLPINCVVFMDEAGLPEESHESLKVLHYHLDNPEVSFVAITNHILDAAKTNRAISLFRPEASKDDLETLAKECLGSDPEYPPWEEDLDMVVKFCTPYSEYMKQPEFSHFFGLRDFIHFVNYLRRKRDKNNPLSLKVVVEAVERNFNGFDASDHFSKFFEVLEPHQTVDQRHILEVMQDSMKDCPQDLAENEVRYKMLIDPSEDDSLVRLLFSFGVLERENTRIFMCSTFPEDGEVQNVNTIAAIRHSAFKGHTVVMSQTDDIHESFYDLFNQRFRRINDLELKQGARYYTNIAIGSHTKPCRVDPNFQCVVVMKKSEVMMTPAPFLNRFEKYLISHKSLLESMLQHFPPYMVTIIQAAKDKVNSFINSVLKEENLYGLQPETLDSLILDFLPPLNYKYKVMKAQNENLENVADVEAVPVYLFREVLKALVNNAGFYIPKYPGVELLMDVEHIFNLIECVSEFSDLLKNLTHQDAMQAVIETFNLLHSSPDSQEDPILTPDGYMVVSILIQVLVRLFVKKLMNLMTTEAVVLCHSKISSLYLENYLSNQAHFSLKEAISNYYMAFKATLHDSCVSPNKVVCFTRSSPLVHILPAHFPYVPGSKGDIIRNYTKTVADLVFEETNKVFVHKLSSLQSQNSVQELLNFFFNSDTAEVCVLLANMQVTTCKMINHIRVMIEEAEPSKSCKMFVMLLHFTPAQFYQHCYPSLFLRGWDHCYLDTVAHSQIKGVVDIQDWFMRCCFPPEKPTDEGDTLLLALDQILHQSISALSARVYFGKKKDSSFNSAMNATQRGEYLKTLLFKKDVGGILCKKFRTYWNPKVMTEYLERAATFSQQRESTLNITDSIQAQFKALFVDFCVYMLTEANKNFNLDIAFDEDRNIHKLFIDIFRVLPVPKLQQLNLLSNDVTNLQPPVDCLRFPFFSYVYEVMEKQVDLSREAAKRKLNLTNKEKCVQGILSTVPAEKEGALVAAVKGDLESQEDPKEVLGLALDAMAHWDIWMLYFNDFIVFKLKLVDLSQQGDITLQLLLSYFERLHSSELPLRMVQLHCHACIHHVSLAQLATTLRPLSKIEGLQQKVLSPIPSPTSITDQWLETVKQVKSLLPGGNHVSSFVVNTLFNVLTVVCLRGPETEKLDLWSKSYRSDGPQIWQDHRLDIKEHSHRKN